MLRGVNNVFRALCCALLLCGAAQAASSYRVKAGDTLSGIAARAGVGVAQLRAANPSLKNTTRIQAGAVLTLPGRSVAATKHHVKAGENLTTIARQYSLTLAQLLRVNPAYASGKSVWAGAVINIPARSAPASGAQASRTPAATLRTASTSRHSSAWLWPLTGYRQLSSDYGRRVLDGEEEMHYGVDIVAPTGTVVRAARAGRVLESRPDFDRGWGWTVVIEHPDGWITRYAHLSVTLIRQGALVEGGQAIGRVGSTGRSTGPHLHFGTYLKWVPRDPLSLY
ncbi:hypothetical protein GCM10010841_17540 [Deinococcus aerophilus]|uniref:LysM domain-containing protein n=1 Tax=Deinococcus aerophilus TaxID=522488 RepID=A0ABQ2GT11_9DEIO|nr:hypothetical protein GCM10010841_17540 [Deinococcus aerophilus]